MELITNKEGKSSATVTVEKLVLPEEGKKLCWVKFAGVAQRVKFSRTLLDLFKIEEGASAVAEIEVVKETYNGQESLVGWLRSWDGRAAPDKRAGGGAGRGGFVPKSAAEIHAPALAAIIAAVIGQGGTVPEAEAFCELYRAQVGKVSA